MRELVLVPEDFPQAARQVLANYEVVNLPGTEEQVVATEVIITWPSRISAEQLARARSLRMIQTISAGIDALPFAAAPREVVICSNAGAFTEPVAEHAWGLMLGVSKGVHLRNQRTTPRLLRGKTLVVVGAGSIGSEVARLSKSIGMRTIGVSRSFNRPEVFDEKYPVESILDVVGRADAILLALPLTSRTKGLIDGKLLERCKEDVTIVNVGRGETVVEKDLVGWLRKRQESRYATDVFWKSDGREKFDIGAWELLNFGGTLHVSGLPRGGDLGVPYMKAAENVRRFLEGGEPLNRIDPEEYT